MSDETTVTADWYHDDKATLGDRITHAREAAGLSVEDLAQQLGVGLAVLEAWETDVKEPRANRIQMLSGVLNVSLRWLLTGQGEDHMPVTDTVTSEELAVLRARLHEALEMVDRIEARLGGEVVHG
ncbi:MAG: helix-turn-helix domain-containing protein [Pseudomonadota bacterium]